MTAWTIKLVIQITDIGKRVLRHDRLVEPVGGASLANRAREEILNSVLERRFEGSRLPPENDLAHMLGVSRTTIRSALQSLEQHGVLTRSPRRGTQVDVRMSPSMVALQRLIGWSSVPGTLSCIGNLKKIVASHKAVAERADAIVEHMKGGPKPRSDVLDKLEIARIEKLREAHEVKHRADRIVQAHHAGKGEAEFVIQTRDGGTRPAEPHLIESTIAEARADIGNGKDATWPNLEFRNGPTGDA